MAYNFDEHEFDSILENYEDLLTKTKKYLSALDSKIDRLLSMGEGVRGLDHNLTGYMDNASNLIAQASAIVDKILKVKKDIINYKLDANKNLEVEDGFREALESLKKQFSDMQKKEKKFNSENNVEDDFDKELDKELDERNKDNTDK